MIPLDFITEWRATAPWIQDSQVEQDLILSRAGGITNSGKLAWSGVVTPVQPRIRLTRSLGQRSHTWSDAVPAETFDYFPFGSAS